MISLKKIAAAAISLFALGISGASAQEGDLHGCLKRLETAVDERNRLLSQIDEHTLNRSDADFVGGYRNTYNRMDVDRDLRACEDATADFEYWNERLRKIIAAQ